MKSVNKARIISIIAGARTNVLSTGHLIDLKLGAGSTAYEGDPMQLEPMQLVDAHKPRRRSKGEKARNRRNRYQ